MNNKNQFQLASPVEGRASETCTSSFFKLLALRADLVYKITNSDFVLTLLCIILRILTKFFNLKPSRYLELSVRYWKSWSGKIKDCFRMN